MKRYVLLIGKENKEKTYWNKIGTVFCGDDSKITGRNGKSATFVIDYPEASGIIKVQEDKEQSESE